MEDVVKHIAGKAKKFTWSYITSQGGKGFTKTTSSLPFTGRLEKHKTHRALKPTLPLLPGQVPDRSSVTIAKRGPQAEYILVSDIGRRRKGDFATHNFILW
ncbi:hypothetical protein [Pyrobaculum sp.]|uniref:hypothetical protein n=1 Tax=Pyrobaculum sp. TaxID=2004705 RepID=UPI0031708E49